MSTGSETSVRSCPVCGSDQWSALCLVDADRVWDALHEEFGTVMPEDVRVRHAPSGGWQLVTCVECGLEHFADAPQGDAKFYALLMSGDLSYEDYRWEFGVVRDLIFAGASVVDIGCGTGAFLRSLPEGPTRTGLDHNRAALEVLQHADPTIYALPQDAAEHADEVGCRYDIVTAFQLLEHVENPRALLRAARRLCRPEGWVYVSVPHRDRSGRGSFEVLDHPPHHLTRWRREQLELAAEAEGLAVDGVWYEPPDESVRMAALSRLADDRFRLLPGPLRGQAVRLVRRVADHPRVRARLLASGWYERRGLTGHTLLVGLRRSS